MKFARSLVLVLELALISITVVHSAQEEEVPIRAGTLKQVVTIVRHGVRYVSTKKFETEIDRKHIGELMPAGRRQMYHLGQILRKLYCDDVFLPSKYLPSTIYLRSTERNRTIESGMCFAAGMYPQDNDEVMPDIFQQYLDAPFDDPIMSQVTPVSGKYPFLNEATSIPVHSLPETMDRSLSPMGRSCNTYIKKVEENVATPVVEQVMKEYADVLAKFREVIDPYLDPKRPPGPLNQLEIHYWRDGIRNRRISGASSIPPQYLELLKNFYDPVTGVDTPLLDGIREFCEIASFIAFFKDEESLRLGSTSFFNELLGIFHKRAEDLNEYKKYQTRFVAYFAHELTVKMVLRALEISSWECQLAVYKQGKQYPKESPCLTETTQFGENVIFELRQAPAEENGELFIVLRYNGKYLYFGCDHKENGEVIYMRECNLKSFEKFARRFMIEDLNHACEYGENRKKDYDRKEDDEESLFNWSSFFVGFFLAIIAAGIAYKLQLNKRQAEGTSNNPTNNHCYNSSQEMRDIVQPLHNQP